MFCILELILDKLLILAFELLMEIRKEVAGLAVLLAEGHIAFVSLSVLVLFGEKGGLLRDALCTLFFQLSHLSFYIFDLLEDNLNVYLVIFYFVDHNFYFRIELGQLSQVGDDFLADLIVEIMGVDVYLIVKFGYVAHLLAEFLVNGTASELFQIKIYMVKQLCFVFVLVAAHL